MSSIFVPNNSSLLGATGIFTPTIGLSSINANSSINSDELFNLKNEITSLRTAVDSPAIVNDIEELKKFTEFLKFRIDSLDTRMTAFEKQNSEMVSKINIMEITITALSAIFKKSTSDSA
jgi:peptidoglycan hydrolase CwlO-like protein